MKHYRTGQQLAKYGRGKDSLLAHITPREAALLKRMGGAGTRNPITGLLEFRPGGPGNDPGAPGSASGVGGDPNAGSNGNDGGIGGLGGFGGFDASTATGVDVGPIGLDNPSPPGVGLGYGGGNPVGVDAQGASFSNNPFGTFDNVTDEEAAAARARTVNMPKPQTPRDIRNAMIDSEIAAAANPGLAAALGLAASASMPSVVGPVAAMLGRTSSPIDPDADLSDHGGFGDPDGPGGAARDRRGGLLSPRPSGGLADTPEAGFGGFTYTDPRTGRVVRYEGGLLPWMT